MSAASRLFVSVPTSRARLARQICLLTMPTEDNDMRSEGKAAPNDASPHHDFYLKREIGFLLRLNLVREVATEQLCLRMELEITCAFDRPIFAVWVMNVR